MGQRNIVNLRGYLYVGLGIAFCIYRVTNTVTWGTWEFIELIAALGMTLIGAYIITRK